MEIERHTDQKTFIDAPKSRVSSPLRMKYEAEVQLIKHKWGSLEDMRKTLGLSQRKMCQLLLVDPSAWTRWTQKNIKDGEDAPPHIYRSLSWYLLLQEKSPDLSPYVFLQTVARPQIPESEIKKVTGRISESLRESFDVTAYQEMQMEIQKLQQMNKKLNLWVYASTFAVLITMLYITLMKL